MLTASPVPGVSTISTLGREELDRRLAGPGLVLRTGAFSTRIHTRIGHLADAIALLYADYPVEAPTAFADFQVRLHRPAGPRHWLKPQVRFDSDGREPFAPLPLAQAYPMFEWVMNWCVSSRAHGYLVIHAAVLERGGRALIMPAPPGSGKSTLCAALAMRGWRLLSDELALLRPEDGMLVPLPRPVSLKNGSIDVVRRFAPDALFSRPVPDTAKGTVAHLKAPADSVARAAETARPAWVVFPRWEAGAAARLAPLARARACLRVAGNAFNYSVLGAAGFALLTQVMDGVDSYEFGYGDLDEAVGVFDALARVVAREAA